MWRPEEHKYGAGYETLKEAAAYEFGWDDCLEVLKKEGCLVSKGIIQSAPSGIQTVGDIMGYEGWIVFIPA